MPAIKLTNSKLKELLGASTGSKSGVSYMDTEVKGLLLRIQPSSASWNIRYSLYGKQRRYKIGDASTIGLVSARKIALKLLTGIANDIDPHQDKRDRAASEITLTELMDQWYAYLGDTKKSKSYLKDCRLIITAIKKNKICQRTIASITPLDIEKYLNPFYSTKPYHHNRVRSAFIAAFKYAEKHEMVDRTPAKSLTKAPEQVREEVLTEVEFNKIISACHKIISDPSTVSTAHHPRITLSTYAILLMAYTGCRPADALAARWDGLDLKRSTWTRLASQTKQRKEQTVELSNAAMEMIKNIPRSPSSVYVFPSKSATGHLTEVRKTWSAICKVACVFNKNKYQLGKYVATMLMHNGASIKELQTIMAWESAATPLKHYAKVQKGECKKRLDQLFTRNHLNKM